MLDQSNLLVVKLDPLASVSMADEAVVVAAPGGVAVVDNHGVQLVRVPSLDGLVVEPARQQRVHRLVRVRSPKHLLLIPVDFLVGQLSVQVVLVEREGEWELHVVGQLALKHIEALHLNA